MIARNQRSETIEQTAARALERAHKSGVEIVARGYRKWDGARVLGVTSASQPNTIHLIAVVDLRLECDCPAARHSTYCIHRALAHQYLLVEAGVKSDRRIAAQERALHSAVKRLIEWERPLPFTPDTIRAESSAAPGADAPLASTAKPISIFK